MLVTQKITGVVSRSVKNYFVHGERSNQKVKELHGGLSNIIEEHMKLKERNLKIVSLPLREHNLKGHFYNKNVDMCILTEETEIPILVISVKFIMSNYRQNRNNYFENMVGECVNLKLSNPKLYFWHMTFLFDQMPYYDKAGTIVKYEKYEECSRLSNCFDYITTGKEENGEVNVDLKLLPNKVSTILLSDSNKLLKHPKTLSKTNRAKYIRKIKRNGFHILNESSILEDFEQVHEWIQNETEIDSESSSEYETAGEGTCVEKDQREGWKRLLNPISRVFSWMTNKKE